MSGDTRFTLLKLWKERQSISRAVVGSGEPRILL